jgi:hypothetical protein
MPDNTQHTRPRRFDDRGRTAASVAAEAQAILAEYQPERTSLRQKVFELHDEILNAEGWDQVALLKIIDGEVDEILRVLRVMNG